MSTSHFGDIVDFIKSQFPDEDFIPLHNPVFSGREKEYVLDAIDSTYVSSVGAYVNKFEDRVKEITKSKFAIATVNGTSALHMSLILANVFPGEEVLSQSLTFIATCNAIKYIAAEPVFIDIDNDTLGMSPNGLSKFLEDNAEIRKDGFSYNKITKRRIAACVPMHTFGLPCRIDQLADICAKWNIVLIEDSAESLGSYYKGRHTGTFGKIGTFSFNGNKIATCGGGGAIVTDSEDVAIKAKHLTTQAKIHHPWAFIHDQVGYNYRMPNLNAALACAQLEQLDYFVSNKRELAQLYHDKWDSLSVKYIKEISFARSNYWLNTIVFENYIEREAFLKYANSNGVMSRPAWELMHRLPMFKSALRMELPNSEFIVDRLINIPSSIRK